MVHAVGDYFDLGLQEYDIIGHKGVLGTSGFKAFWREHIRRVRDERNLL